MNIVLFLNKDIEANITYNLLKEELLGHNVKVYYSDTVGNEETKPSELLKLEYFEKRFFFNELSNFVKENEVETNFEFFNSNFTSFPIEKCSNPNSKEFIEKIKEFSPDLFISIRFGKIFKEEIIKVPSKGLINLHSAVLPDYRGIMGTLHAIKDKNEKIGCTLHTIPNKGIDTGEIIEIARCNTNYEKSLFWNLIQLYPLGANLILATINSLQQEKDIEKTKQDLNEGSYFSVPSENDFNQIKNLGMEVISEEDYYEVITNHVLKRLSAEEKQQLRKDISNNGLLTSAKA